MVRTLARTRDREDVLRRLSALRHDSAARWGRMSAHQMVCHLSDGYRLVTGERSSPLATVPLPRPMMKCIALYMPLRWPRGLATTPELDQIVGGTRPVDFAADVAALAALIERIARECRGAGGPPHPIFGRMSVSSWMRWAYLHADHHLRQFGL
jgi:hypothetical protein